MTTADPTSLGSILVRLGMITTDQLDSVIKLLESSRSLDILLGRVAVTEGLITDTQLQEALTAQSGLRSRSKPRQALAQARLATMAADSVMACASQLRTKAVAASASIRGSGFNRFVLKPVAADE